MIVQKEAISVTEMARMVGLSRQRFYQLVVSGTFPPPVYDVATRRPFYSADLQAVCLEVRKRNCGVNGRPVLFYPRRREIEVGTPRRARKKPAAVNNQYDDATDRRSCGRWDW